MGLAQLSKAERMLKRRRQIAKMYDDAFSPNPKLQVPSSNDGHAWHLYMLRLNVGGGWKWEVGQVRARFIEELKRRNIGASVHFIPLHVHPYYRQTYGYKPEDFPNAYQEFLREVSLPVYSRMTDEDAADVIAAVQEIVETYTE
jgi:dTDP-4-amino-4,6-dideoxygalactose transaminase